MDPHPELASRLDAFLAECARRGWSTYVKYLGRSQADQATLYRLWINHLTGREPSRAVEAANPYAYGDVSPFGFRTRGSKHMVQADGFVHAADLALGGAPAGELHAAGLHFGLIFPVPRENWHVEFWTGGVLIPRHDLYEPHHFEVPPAPEPDPPIKERRKMPSYIIKGERPDDAWFAIYGSGLVRHIGGDEAGFLLGKQIEIFTEHDRAAYLSLIAQSGTDWRAA